jgi:hypothetical protein
MQMPRTQNQSTESSGTVDHEVGDASGTGHVTEPRMPERTRILRPGLWVEAMVAMLSDFAFRLYLGLMTCADDEGWLLWRPSTLAAHLLRFRHLGRREAALDKGAAELLAAGLLVVHDCGCAYLPYLHRDFRIKGGNHAVTVLRFHESHASLDESVQVGTSPASVSVSVSESVSDRASDSVSDSGVASGSGSGSTPSSDVQTNKKNDDPWTGWNPLWDPVREAMARRGFHHPPNGETDEEGTQRDHLWRMVHENPNLVAQIIDEAPAHLCAGQSRFFELVGHIFKEWNAVASGVRS